MEGLQRSRAVLLQPTGLTRLKKLPRPAASSVTTLTSYAGDVYHGELREGLIDGMGSITMRNGSTLYGSWRRGKLHGQAVLVPPRTQRSAAPVLQHFADGQLLEEHELGTRHEDVNPVKLQCQAKQEYLPPKAGASIYKGHNSYQLMKKLQLGIMFSIAEANQVDCTSPLSLAASDFTAASEQYFPSSTVSLPFKWKNYAPRAFHNLRRSFGIDDREYVISLAGETALRELPSPGKSGSVFFLSEDDRFLVKTVRHEEMRLLLKLVPEYYKHVQQNPQTLLVHFCGVHRISPLIGLQARFTIMGNVLPSNVRLHRKYDLKGSTWGRSVGEQRRQTDPFVTLKDLDLDMQLVLFKEDLAAIMQQLDRDCRLLEEMGVIDYSLLLGVHFKRWGDGSWSPPFCPWPSFPAGWLDGQKSSSVALETDFAMRQTVQVSKHAAEQAKSTVHTDKIPSRSPVLQNTIAERVKTSSSKQCEGLLMKPTQTLEQRPAHSELGPPKTTKVNPPDETSLRDGEDNPVSMQRRISCIHQEANPAQWCSSFAHSQNSFFCQEQVGGSTDWELSGGINSPINAVENTATPATTRVAETEAKMGGASQQPHAAGRSIGGISAVAILKNSRCSREPVLVWLGIIDFLQCYTLRKKLEHVWKSVVQDASAISAVNPRSYRERFMLNIQQLFVADTN